MEKLIEFLCDIGFAFISKATTPYTIGPHARQLGSLGGHSLIAGFPGALRLPTQCGGDFRRVEIPVPNPEYDVIALHRGGSSGPSALGLFLCGPLLCPMLCSRPRGHDYSNCRLDSRPRRSREGQYRRDRSALNQDTP